MTRMTASRGPAGHNVNIRDVDEGRTVRLHNGDLGIVTANPKDGYWLEVQLLVGSDLPIEGDEREMVFVDEIAEVIPN